MAERRTPQQTHVRLGSLFRYAAQLIVFGFIFYAVVTLVGVLVRLVRRDPLALRFDPHAASYWVGRVPPGPPPNSMKGQY